MSHMHTIIFRNNKHCLTNVPQAQTMEGFFEAIPRLPLFLCHRLLLFHWNKSQHFTQRTTAFKTAALCSHYAMTQRAKNNILNRFQDSKTINYLRESSTGDDLQFLFELSEMSGRSLTPPCYVSSQNMTKSSVSLSHFACPKF